MPNQNDFKQNLVVARPITPVGRTFNPVWQAFIEYCAELGHGEIEILKIQDGMPVMAEIVRKKIKFTR